MARDYSPLISVLCLVYLNFKYILKKKYVVYINMSHKQKTMNYLKETLIHISQEERKEILHFIIALMDRYDIDKF